MTKKKSRAPLFLYRFRFRGVLLRVNHDALERIDCAPHLGVLGLDDILFVLGFDISRVAQRKEGALLFCSHGNTNIRNHAIALNDLLARCVVFAVVKRTADPSGNCITFCTEPFPKVVSPMRMARCRSLSAPETISAPLALPSLIRRAIGKFGRSFFAPEVA